MNVTTHKYADPYELWWRQFPPMEPSTRLHGAAMLTRRASVSCRHPVKGRMTQNLVGQLRRKLMLSRHVNTRIGDSLRRLTHPTPSIRVPHPTRRTTRPRRGLSLLTFKISMWLRHHPRRPTPVTEPQGNPIDDAMSGSINVELPLGSRSFCFADDAGAAEGWDCSSYDEGFICFTLSLQCWWSNCCFRRGSHECRISRCSINYVLFF
ncbi:hypothetical protein TcG_09200 [Trypanosoma cruzi]|nr:hypothetical protein TcG_09200 [Trypanosoma cruzi]